MDTHVEFGFSIQNASNSGGRISNNNEAQFVLVSIKNSINETVYEKKQLKLYDFNGYLISEKISLLPGNYSLTEFFVLDETDRHWLGLDISHKLNQKNANYIRVIGKSRKIGNISGQLRSLK